MIDNFLANRTQDAYVFFVVAILGLIVAIPLVNLIAKIRRHIAVRRAQLLAVNQRQPQPPKGVHIRQTDLESAMTREDRAKFDEAEHLIATGQIFPAAQLLESIRFQRKAIDILEQHGFIDEACNILLRMRVPLRAAVIYERNQMLDKAAHYYHAANKIEKSAECYKSLALKNFRYLTHAADACLKAGDMRSHLQAKLMGMQLDGIVEQCFQHSCLDLLVEAMRDPVVARSIFGDMTQDQRQNLFRFIPMLPQNVQMLANWLWMLPDEYNGVQVVQKTAHEPELATYFWKIIPSTVRGFLVELSIRQSKMLSL